MLMTLGLHGSSGHPDVIRSFVEALAPRIPCFCPSGTFPDGDGLTFFQRRPDFNIPAETVLDLARALGALLQPNFTTPG